MLKSSTRFPSFRRSSLCLGVLVGVSCAQTVDELPGPQDSGTEEAVVSRSEAGADADAAFPVDARVLSEAMPDTGLRTPDAAPDVSHDAAPDVSHDAAPDVSHDAAPDVSHDAAPASSAWRVCGTSICAGNTPVFLKGYSGYGAFSVAYDYGAHLDLLKSRGINLLREWGCPTPKGWGGEAAFSFVNQKPVANEAFFDNARRFATEARARDMYVLVDLLDHWALQRGADRFDDNPLNTANGGPLSRGLPDAYDSPEVADMMVAAATELSGQPNIIYQIANEPAGYASVAQIRAFHTNVIQRVRKAHPGALIAINPVNDKLAAFVGLPADLATIHHAGVVDSSRAEHCSAGNVAKRLAEVSTTLGIPVVSDTDGLWSPGSPCSRDDLSVLSTLANTAAANVAGFNHKGAEPPWIVDRNALAILKAVPNAPRLDPGETLVGGAFYDYVVDESSVGHLVDLEQGEFVYQTLVATHWTPRSRTGVRYAPPKDGLYNKPTLAVSGGVPYLFWGGGPKPGAGISWIAKSGANWTAPKTFLADHAVEQIKVLGFQGKIYLAAFTTSPFEGITVYEFQNGALKPLGQVDTKNRGGKAIDARVTRDAAWFYSFYGSSGIAIEATKPANVIDIPNTGEFSGTIVAGKPVVAYAEVAVKRFPKTTEFNEGLSCSLNDAVGAVRCWYVSKIVYKSAKGSQTLHTFNTPSDEVLLKSYQWPNLSVGAVRDSKSTSPIDYVVFDDASVSYLVQVEGEGLGKITKTTLGDGSEPRLAASSKGDIQVITKGTIFRPIR